MTVITISCRILTPLSRRSLFFFFTKSLTTQRSQIIPADSVHCCHGAHRCILQTLCPVDTAVIIVSRSLFSATTVYWRLPQNLYVAATAFLSLLPNTLLPATPVDIFKLVNVYCRLGAMLQPARQCLLQTFCCSSRHRYFLHIYLSYCHLTKQCILQALHTAATALPDVHGAHIAFLPWRSACLLHSLNCC